MPKPEKHVFVCAQARPQGHPRGSCSEKGCMGVLEEFLMQMQQKDLYSRFQVTSTGCLGPCSEGPSVLVYPEAIMYAGVKKEDVATIIDQHLLAGEPVESLIIDKEFWG